MSKLTEQQILEVLRMDQTFPQTIWFTEVRGMDTISIQTKKDIPLEDALSAVRTILPNASCEKYITSDRGFYLWDYQDCVGTIYLAKKEKPSTAMESNEEINPLQYNTNESIAEMVEREA